MALSDCEAHEQANTTQCGRPIALAYHTETDGWWRVTAYKCQPCSADQEKPVYHEHVYLDPDYPAEQATPFALTGDHATVEIRTETTT